MVQVISADCRAVGLPFCGIGMATLCYRGLRRFHSSHDARLSFPLMSNAITPLLSARVRTGSATAESLGSQGAGDPCVPLG